MATPLPHLPDSEPFAFIDGRNAQTGEYGVWVLSDPQPAIASASPASVHEDCARIERIARERDVLMLLDYELGAWLEPAASAHTAVPLARPPLLALPFATAQWLPADRFDAWLAGQVEQLPESQRHAGLAALQYGIGHADYLAAVERILDHLRAGDCYQVNFTWPVTFERYGAPLALYRALRRSQPVHHGAFVQCPDRTILSLSPELFLERRGTTLTSRPIKGTILRGADAEADAANRRRLVNSAKDRAENLMIVDLIRNDLGRIARVGTVRVDALFDIETYPTVHQMASTVRAEADQATLHDILHALFPCASVTGAPKINAMRIAERLESGPRHLYTGSIGHLRPNGDFSFNVAIRTLEFDGAGRGRLGIGSGIVADSDAASEYEECLLKARFATDLPVDFELIETMLCEPQAVNPYPHLARHLQRLRESARHFGFRYDEKAVLKALYAELAGQTGLLRTRLTLSKAGTIRLRHALLDATLPDDRLPRVVLASEPVDSSDVFLRHKTTVRGLYDRVLAQVTAMPGHFDALFFNERNELTEGARSNVFLRVRGVWKTPALHCGLLNGVMRQDFIARMSGAVEETVLHREDLLAADEIHVTNAVRGVMRVELDLDRELGIDAASSV